MKKLLLIFLIFTQMLLYFACASGDGEVKNDIINDEQDTTVTFASEETMTEIHTDIEPVDYEGDEIIIVSYPQEGINFNMLDVKADEHTGEPINDAVYTRNLSLEEKYNITITVFETTNRAGVVKSMVTAGDQTYDIALPGLSESFQLGYTDYVYNLNDIPYIDFTKPWWNSNITDDTKINGKNFFAIGDINILSYEGMGVMMFEKNLVNTYDIESPYETVKNGTWTFDKFAETSKLMYFDINGNGEYDRDDQYGFTANEYSSDCFAFCTDMQYVVIDNDGAMKLNVNNDKFISYFTKVIEFINDETLTLYADKAVYRNERQTLPLKLFTEGRSLYYVETMAFITQLRNMELDFGLIPFPKYDETQNEYYNFIHTGCSSAVVIPVTITDTDKIGRIIEDMAYFSYINVRPAYYEVTIQGKYIRDDESYEMLDYILLNSRCDLSQALRSSGFNFINDLRTMVTGNNTALVSMIASKENAYINALEKINESLSQ